VMKHPAGAAALGRALSDTGVPQHGQVCHLRLKFGAPPLAAGKGHNVRFQLSFQTVVAIHDAKRLGRRFERVLRGLSADGLRVHERYLAAQQLRKCRAHRSSRSSPTRPPSRAFVSRSTVSKPAAAWLHPLLPIKTEGLLSLRYARRQKPNGA
jgi:hypothetical protein